MKNKCASCNGSLDKEESLKLDSSIVKTAKLIKIEKITCKACKKTLDKKV